MIRPFFFRAIMLATLTLTTALALTPIELVAGPTVFEVRAHILQWEGRSHQPYRDRDNSWIVGLGHNLTAHMEPVGTVYTDQQVEDLFQRDYRNALSAARVYVRLFDQLPDDVQCVVLGVVWTCGRTGLSRWTRFRSALSARDYTQAAREIYRSKWAGQVGGRRAGAYWLILATASTRQSHQ